MQNYTAIVSRAFSVRAWIEMLINTWESDDSNLSWGTGDRGDQFHPYLNNVIKAKTIRWMKMLRSIDCNIHNISQNKQWT